MKAFGTRPASTQQRAFGVAGLRWPRTRWSAVGLTATIVLVGWFATLAKTGSGLDLSVEDYVKRANSLPSVLLTNDPLADYRNWSILPMIVARLSGVDASFGFAAVQCGALVVGSTVLLSAVAWRRPQVAYGAALALFATMAPSYAMRFMGSYDQVLLVALVAVAIVDTSWAAALIGVVIGLTHAEVGFVALLGLTLLAAIGVGVPVRTRLWALGGLVGARTVLTIALTAAGQPSDRLTFVREYGVGRMAGYFADTWPAILLAVASGGWLILAAAVAERRSRRLALVVLSVVVVNLCVTALTIDQSRVAMFSSLPFVVTIGSAAPLADGSRPWWARASVPVAALVGLATPLFISWVGEYWYFAGPLRIQW